MVGQAILMLQDDLGKNPSEISFLILL